MKRKVFVKEQNGNEVEGCLEIEESHIELALIDYRSGWIVKRTPRIEIEY